MSEPILVDAGPLVALFSQHDQHYEQCHHELRSLHPPLLTCWPVLTEAAWLLRRRPRSLRQLLDGFEQGLLRIAHLDDAAPAWIADFIERYDNLGAQIADAALMYLAERDGIDTVFTLDRRDFTVYRTRDKQPVRLIPEP